MRTLVVGRRAAGGYFGAKHGLAVPLLSAAYTNLSVYSAPRGG